MLTFGLILYKYSDYSAIKGGTDIGLFLITFRILVHSNIFNYFTNSNKWKC